jgi:hypothetical protein
MDPVVFAARDEFGGRVVGVEFDLVDSRDGLAAGRVQKSFKVANAKVRDADVVGHGLGDFLHLGPCLDEVPAGKVFGGIGWVGRGGPMLLW